jgi:alcohol dehydrogenase (cytochrome c)
MRVTTVLFIILLAASALPAQDADPGRVVFEGRCARCHGADGNGGELGPAIRGRLASRTNEQLAALIRNGLPGHGMPPSQISDAEMEPLTRFLRSLQPRNFRRPVVREKLATTDGKTLEGEIRNQGFDDLQILTDDHRVHLLRRAGDKFREVTSSTDWPGYRNPGGNRYTTLAQITKANVSRLGPKWIFTLPTRRACR